MNRSWSLIPKAILLLAAATRNQPTRRSKGYCHKAMVMVVLNGMKNLMLPIDQAGRIVLPKHVRQELAVKPGDTFKVSIHGSAVTLTPNKAAGGFLRKGKALVFV